MVFNATFNNISVIWWQSVLLLGDSDVPGENISAASKILKTQWISLWWVVNKWQKLGLSLSGL
jgi:hypothetical protein